MTFYPFCFAFLEFESKRSDYHRMESVTFMEIHEQSFRFMIFNDLYQLAVLRYPNLGFLCFRKAD